MNIYGLKNETNIINYINKYKYINLMNDNMRSFLCAIFKFDITKYSVKAEKYISHCKPDIVITVNNISKYISVKYGDDNSIHHEHIYSFLNFLKENGVKDNVINNLKLFHFNDGTLNGSGNQRKSAKSFLLNNTENIQKINKVLNEIKKTILKRIFIKGEYHHLPTVDYIYYGNVEKGMWASEEELIDFFCNTNIQSNSIHISKIYYQTFHRNLKFNLNYEFRRYYCQFKWHSIKKDLSYITQKRKK